MSKKKILLICLALCFRLIIFAETDEQRNILNEYNIVLNRVMYSKQSGFCFDGAEFIPELKTPGSETSFFIEAQNIYLKVINTAENKTYFTRCFDVKKIDDELAVNSEFKLYPLMTVTGHWNFFKLAKKLNVTICDDATCKNVEMTLYEINEKPLSVKNGIFFTFKDGAEKKAVNVQVVLNAKALPSVNINEEEKKAAAIFKKMENHFTSAQIQEKKKEFYNSLKSVINFNDEASSKN